MPKSKAKAKPAKSVGKAVESQEEEVPEEANPYDIRLDYSLELQNPDGIPVRVTGSIPFEGALLPAFLRDSSKTIEDTVESLVKSRFLTQVRHFFNERMERELEERKPSNQPVPTLPPPSRPRVPVLELEVDPGEPEVIDVNEEESKKAGDQEASGETDES